MINTLLVLTVLVPMAALTIALFPRARRAIGLTIPIVPLPAFLAALLVSSSVEYRFEWLLFSGSWSLDSPRRILLASMAAVWCIGGCFALASRDTRTQLPRLVLPWLATLSGNMWLAVAQDIGGFYSGFALMSFGAYALVVFDGTPASRSAGRLYLVFAVLGEMAILSGLLLASHAGANNGMHAIPAAIAGSPIAVIITSFLLIGFGVKCALLGVHMWLPSVYTAAPAPVRVILGGAMINAGVLGWLCTLPLGTDAAAAMSLPLVMAGLVAALGAAVIGTMQGRAATVLGYSSISQMGMITVLLGAGLGATDAIGQFVLVIALFAAHHGVTKGALFLSIELVSDGVRRGWLLFVLPALVLAGAPLTTGAMAKLLMKSTLYNTEWSWVIAWLSAAAVGTTLLMARALWCALHERSARADTATEATSRTLLGFGAVAVLLLGHWWIPSASTPVSDLTMRTAVDLLWPIALGSGLAAMWWRRRYDGWRVPAGDLLLPLIAMAQGMTRMTVATVDGVAKARVAVLARSRPEGTAANPTESAAERSEAWLQRHASFILVVVMLLVAALLTLSPS